MDEGMTYMRKNDDVIFGQMNVGLEGVSAYFGGGFEGSHGVFWMRGFVASMGDGLRKLSARLVFPRPYPVRCHGICQLTVMRDGQVSRQHEPLGIS